MNSTTISKNALFPYRLVIGLMALLALENPEIATSQPPSDQSRSSDSTSTTKTASSASSSATETEGDIFRILKEEKESISRGLGQEQPISEAPANVYVITDEDIRHSGATDIPTVLRRIPGMEVMQMTGADFNVSTRGNNQTAANHLLVLVDGRPIYEYAFGNVFWSLLPVTLPEIKKIEVMKGPSASIYGFNAFDGVINIVTKSPQEMKGNTNGTYAQFGGGEFGTIRSTLIQAGTHGDFGYRLSFGHDQNQKWSNRDTLALRSNKFNLQTEYSLKDNSKISLSGGFIDSNRFDGQVYDVVHESSQLSNGYVQASYERSNFFIRTSWTRWDRNSLALVDPQLRGLAAITDRNGNPSQTFRHDVYTLWTQHTVDIGSTNRLIYGVNAFHNVITQVNVFDSAVQENRFGTYVQDEWRITNNLTFVPGIRIDLHSELNPTYSPRVAVLYQPTQDHTFRISGSMAFRPPNPLETHTDQRNVIIPLGLSIPAIGSRNLQAEKIVSYEAGYQGWYWKHRLRVRGDVFFNHLSNSIGVIQTPNGTFTSANFGQADIYGAEVGFEFLATSWLTGFFNYSTVQVHQTSDLVAAQGLNTRGAPPYKISAGLRGEWDNGLSAESVVHHVAASSYPVSPAFSLFNGFFGGIVPPDSRVPAYTLLNVRGAYRFWKDRAEVAIAAFNAINDRHQENPVGDVIGSRVVGWLTLRY